MAAGRGLSQVVDADLKRVLRALHREHLPSPLTRAGLIAGALGHIEEHLDVLVGLDTRAAKAVVTAVLAERDHQRAGSAVLSVCGPAVAGTISQDSVAQVADMIARAHKSVLLVGASARDDASLLRTVEAMSEPRGVEVTLIGRDPSALDPLRAEAPEGWTLYAPEALTLESRAVVIDRARALLLSDTLSGREQDDRLHLGAIIDDASWVDSLLAELERLTRSGRFVSLR